ncbi:hypothetical protein QBC32DRAFT_129377 [Pseudoneurospora amorphoporcata]|uniref:Uncharacterized protein n=1 Tax=Pseudoneurospora amorphoporcata TaxID=241081 RepID=A0AAN6SGY7_9PEZI|nr:hypothetical protein QBC32DRAFT_129377 [Pseudoneurospora amorphoporcata]
MFGRDGPVQRGCLGIVMTSTAPSIVFSVGNQYSGRKRGSSRRAPVAQWNEQENGNRPTAISTHRPHDGLEASKRGIFIRSPEREGATRQPRDSYQLSSRRFHTMGLINPEGIGIGRRNACLERTYVPIDWHLPWYIRLYTVHPAESNKDCLTRQIRRFDSSLQGISNPIENNPNIALHRTFFCEMLVQKCTLTSNNIAPVFPSRQAPSCSRYPPFPSVLLLLLPFPQSGVTNHGSTRTKC